MANKPSYYELLKHPLWQRQRLEVMARAHFRCETCAADDQTLTVHHSYYERGLKPWDYPSESLHVLCEQCHREAQDRLTLLHQQIGKLALSEIDQLYGYALGLFARSNPDAPIDVATDDVAEGIAANFSLSAVDVFALTRDGVTDGSQLLSFRTAMQRALLALEASLKNSEPTE